MLTIPALFRRSTAFLAAAFILLLLAGGGIAWLLAHQGLRRPLRVLLIVPPGGAVGSGLEPGEARALGALVQDHLEVAGGFAVTNVIEMPPRLEMFSGQPRSLLLQLEPKRVGANLILSYRFLRGDRIPRQGEPTWDRREGTPLPPAEAFQQFLLSFPAPMRGTAQGLVPRDSADFWSMNQASTWRLQNIHLEEATALLEQVARREPSCATAWLLLGNLRYRRMLNNPGVFREEQAAAQADLERALQRVPAHPRPAFLLSLIQSDSGNQRQALELLMRARRLQPANPTLLTGVAYAARGAGLLPLARRAIELRDTLAWADLQPQAVDITYLYTGELNRFEASLQERPGHLRSTSGVLPFYRGYLALVRGDRSTAQREFQYATTLAHGYPNIQRLSEIYGLILEGRHAEAWQKLREYDQERIGMREPDGEFTLRLAEAYALMGDRASAMEMAGRAFARGFGCTDWYERSPMLDSLRALPKWQALMQHLRERQKLMEDGFPAGLLESN